VVGWNPPGPESVPTTQTTVHSRDLLGERLPGSPALPKGIEHRFAAVTSYSFLVLTRQSVTLANSAMTDTPQIGTVTH